MAGGKGGIKTRHQNEEGTRPLPPCMEDPWQAANSSQTLSRRRKTLSVSPFEGEDLVPEVWRNPGPRVSPLHRGGEQEGSCDAGILRFPHRLTDPRCEGEDRSPAGLPPHSLALVHNPSGKPEPTRTDDPRPRRGRTLWLSECQLVRRFPSPCWPVKKGPLGPSWRAG